MIEIRRRQLITGLVSLIAAPAIVRASSLMPVKAIAIHPADDKEGAMLLGSALHDDEEGLTFMWRLNARASYGWKDLAIDWDVSRPPQRW